MQPDIEEKLAAAEDQLDCEADSFGALLSQLESYIAPALISGQGWTKLLERARELPSTVAAFPFGFELPLGEREAKADFGVSVIGGTRSAAFFERQGRSPDATAPAAGLTWLLNETKSADSAVRQIFGHKMMLEYDVESAPDETSPAPGIFLRPVEPIIGGDQQAAAAALDATFAAVGWNPTREEHRHVRRVCQALENGARIESFGAFPSRIRGLRLAVTGFRNSGDILAFLERAGWPGQPDVIGSLTIKHFEERDAFVDLGAHLDITSDGPGARLGVSFMAKKRIANDPRYWIDSPYQWTTFMDCLRESDLAVPEKLTALTRWPSKPEALICRSGALILIRGIHHIKISLCENRADAVKAYIYCLMCPWSSEYKTEGP